MIGGLVQREGEDHPDMRLYLVPVSEVKQDDTWYCAGLRASGSNTSVLDNVFVPEHRSVSPRSALIVQIELPKPLAAIRARHDPKASQVPTRTAQKAIAKAITSPERTGKSCRSSR